MQEKITQLAVPKVNTKILLIFQTLVLLTIAQHDANLTYKFSQFIKTMQ